MLLEELLHQRPGARAGLAHNKFFPLEALRRNRRCLRQRMIRSSDNRVRMRGNRLRPRRQFLGRAPHHRQIDFVAMQLLHQLVSIAHFESEVDARMFRAKRRQQTRQEILGGAHHAQRHAPALEPAQPRQ